MRRQSVKNPKLHLFVRKDSNATKHWQFPAYYLRIFSTVFICIGTVSAALIGYVGTDMWMSYRDQTKSGQSADQIFVGQRPMSASASGVIGALNLLDPAWQINIFPNARSEIPFYPTEVRNAQIRDVRLLTRRRGISLSFAIPEPNVLGKLDGRFVAACCANSDSPIGKSPEQIYQSLKQKGAFFSRFQRRRKEKPERYWLFWRGLKQDRIQSAHVFFLASDGSTRLIYQGSPDISEP